MNSAAERAIKRSLTWLEAYNAQQAGAYEMAARLYEEVAVMHEEAGMPKNAAHYREMANIMRHER